MAGQHIFFKSSLPALNQEQFFYNSPPNIEKYVVFLLTLFIPFNMPSQFKENLISLIQEVCYRHQFSEITVTELDDK